MILTFNSKLFLFLFVMFFVSVTLADTNNSIFSWRTFIDDNKQNSLLTGIADDFAEELTEYLNRNKTNKLISKPMLKREMEKAMAAGTIDIVVPSTILDTVKYCIEYDFIPWGMVTPTAELTNKFCKYIIISRTGKLNKPEDLINTTWCVSGRYIDIDFLAGRRKLIEVLKTNNLQNKIKLHRIYDKITSLTIPGRRHSVIQSVLVHDADWAIVPEYDFKSYINLFPAISKKLEEVKWLDPNLKLPGYLILCKKSSFNKLKQYRKEGLNIHNTPAGNQFLISAGFERVSPVPDNEFRALTNWYSFFPDTDNFDL